MLKEQLIERLRRQPWLLKNDEYMTVVDWKTNRYDFIGLILFVSGYPLQLCDSGLFKLPMNAPEVERQWLDLEDDDEIPALARQLWAAEYGEKEAKMLPFYDDSDLVPGAYWWDSMEEVTPGHLIKLLIDGPGDIYNLNIREEDED